MCSVDHVHRPHGRKRYQKKFEREKILKNLVFEHAQRLFQFKGECPFNFHRGVKDTFMSEKP